MSSLARFVVASLLLAACALAVVEARPPSRTCRICEDVAQTYHDRYQCAGHEVDLWGAGDDPLIPACETVQFACHMLSGDIAEACRTMETELYENDDQARTLWMSQMEFGNHYDTCVKLGKCEADPNPEEKEYASCNQVFRSHEGKHNILHPAFTSNCTEECYLCNWLVKEWPLFQEICVPDGTQMPNSIDPDREVQKESGLESIKKLEAAKHAHEEEIRAFEQEAEREEAEAAQEAAHQAEAGGEEHAEGGEEHPPEEGGDGEEAAFLQRRLRQQWLLAQQHPQASSPTDAGADEQLMAASHQAWESQAPYAGADPVSFLETGVRLRGMQRAWSKATTKAIHGVLQSQAGSAPRAPSTKQSVDLIKKDFDGELSRDDALELAPQLGGTDLKADCFEMWRYFVRSRKAKFFASWKHTIGIEITPADVQRSNLWDANIACKCLGQCGLDAFEHLGLIKQCRYDERDKTMMEYAFQTPT